LPAASRVKLSTMSLALRSLLFTILVPGSGAVWIPWWILTRGETSPEPAVWPAVGLIALGAALNLWCLWLFATIGRGTPGPWDAPRRVVAVGPYRWVRNPIYLAALLVVAGEALLFLSLPLLAYGGAAALLPPVRDRLRGADVASQIRRTLRGGDGGLPDSSWLAGGRIEVFAPHRPGPVYAQGHDAAAPARKCPRPRGAGDLPCQRCVERTRPAVSTTGPEYV
jgi:protein-S-isoprenylcysteine O-methyltransferase Ste14